ncbi:hypothetical protein [Streptomyces laculatispora]|uniref:hypothetical protein n=1 Tax=Streptomyces laculatispora TaxID=887464 RepID=UPI001F5E6266|nr:hypothetical protein [Streptomyces laculatispora]
MPWLDAAMDADRIIAAGLDGEAGGPHPLAGWVHTRDTAHMLAWALNGTVPPALAGRLHRPRRGPVAAAPQLAAADRAVFFDHLRGTTEAAARQGESGRCQLVGRGRGGAGLRLRTQGVAGRLAAPVISFQMVKRWRISVR